MNQWHNVTTLEEHRYGYRVEFCRETGEYRHRRVKDRDGKPFLFNIADGKPELRTPTKED